MNRILIPIENNNTTPIIIQYYLKEFHKPENEVHFVHIINANFNINRK